VIRSIVRLIDWLIGGRATSLIAAGQCSLSSNSIVSTKLSHESNCQLLFGARTGHTAQGEFKTS
jgi:hypothetical protein